jgi:hypothetical protein
VVTVALAAVGRRIDGESSVSVERLETWTAKSNTDEPQIEIDLIQKGPGAAMLIAGPALFDRQRIDR